MLYTKDISQVTWDVVVNFCNQQIPEGAALDYKKDFPQNLQKTIAAFANTIGGVILIGVEENQENKPKLPIEGIDFDKSLNEKVYNIILTNITPPVFPEVNVCRNPNGDKAVVVIRVPQSHQTPHAINENTQVYMRTGNRNNFEMLAKIDELFWLKDHRNKSEILREDLIANAIDRFKRIEAKEFFRTSKQAKSQPPIKDCYLTLILCPLYPKNVLITPPDLLSNINEIYVKDSLEKYGEFPLDTENNRKLSKDSVLLYHIFSPYSAFTELNIFGLYFFKQNLLGSVDKENNTHKQEIVLGEVVARVDQIIDSAKKYFNLIGYQGALSFYFNISGISNYKLLHGMVDSSFENNIDYMQVLTVNSIDQEKHSMIVNSISKLCWAYNYNINEDSIKLYLK